MKNKLTPYLRYCLQCGKRTTSFISDTKAHKIYYCSRCRIAVYRYLISFYDRTKIEFYFQFSTNNSFYTISKILNKNYLIYKNGTDIFYKSNSAHEAFYIVKKLIKNKDLF